MLAQVPPDYLTLLTRQELLALEEGEVEREAVGLEKRTGRWASRE